MIPEVSTAVEVGANQPVDHVPSEQIRSLDGFQSERIEQQGAQHAAQPVVSRNVEALFLPPQNLAWKFVAHQMPQNNFQRGIVDLQIFWKLCCKLDDAVIQKRRPNLD